MEKKLNCVLLVDDDDATNFMSRLVIERAGITEHIEIALNGREAIEYLNQTVKQAETAHTTVPSILVLLDINMPIMDGMECVKAIRELKDKKKATLPVVAITGNAKNYSETDFKEAGFNDALMKPLNFDKLVNVVKGLTE